MGDDPTYFTCGQFVNNKWYIVEMRAYGPDQCPGPCDEDWGEIHCVKTGWSLNNWVCGNFDMTCPATMCGALGCCQKLLKVWGPWDTQVEALMAMW